MANVLSGSLETVATAGYTTSTINAYSKPFKNRKNISGQAKTAARILDYFTRSGTVGGMVKYSDVLLKMSNHNAGTDTTKSGQQALC